ncbi:hypothetical protein LPJ61_000019 [Coemansia biformis]|uniref:Cytosine-specific methyltransferase n=1 Tax=Coemansia biformis TaxID=1286918 RepID=A0A9W8D1D1_9FUNG|nr:hypothetical protein LPJ61_000019 [Coemansia biformis]
MDSGSETTPVVPAGPRSAPKRKRATSPAVASYDGVPCDTADGLREPFAGDSDQDETDNARWDISRLTETLPRALLPSGLTGKGARGPAPSLPQKMRFYTAPEDEEIEHADLEVLNESPPDDCEAELTDDLPCRVLDNFVVFDQDCGNAVADLDDVGLEGTDVTIAGNVEPLKASDADSGGDGALEALDEDEDDDEERGGGNSSSCEAGYDSESRAGAACGAKSGKAGAKGSRAGGRADSWGASRSGSVECAGGSSSSRFTQHIRLSAMLNYETYVTPSDETEVWVRTCFAWYKLLNPHPGYMHIYSPLFKRVYMAHQAIARAKLGRTLTVAQFIRELRESPSDIVSRLPPITEGDFRKYREAIIEEIEICLEATGHLELMDAPLIRTICGLGGRGKVAKRPRAGADSLARGTRTTGKTVVIGEPKHENPACVTPLIASIAQGLYARHLMNVSAFEAAAAAQGSGRAGAGAGTPARTGQADAWKKKYTEGSKSKQPAADNAQGVVSLADLQRHLPIKRIRPGGIRCPDGSRLPQIERDRVYYSEIVVSASGDDSDDASSDEAVVKVGRTVLVRALRPAGGHDIGSLWEATEEEQAENAAAEGDSTAVRIIQVVSIMYAAHERRWMLHGRLLLPGRDTVLQEVAMPNEWYLVDSCRTYWLSDSLCGTVDVTFVPSAQEIDAYKWATEQRLFCRFWYEASSGMFEDVNMHIQGTGAVTPMWCLACKLKKQKPDVRPGRIIVGVQPTLEGANSGSAFSSPLSRESAGRVLPEYKETVTVGGVEYHVNDTVYILSEHSDQPFQLGYILRFAGDKARGVGGAGQEVEVQILKRMRILPQDKRPAGVDNAYDDERHVYWTPLVQFHAAASLRGKCWVSHPDDIDGPLNAYKDADANAFYAQYESTRIWPDSEDDWIVLKPGERPVGSADAVGADSSGEDERMPEPPRCAVCRRDREHRARLLAQFLSPPAALAGPPADGGARANPVGGRHPLRALDLFSGCGGLTQGMDQSGVVKTMWSVEYMPSAGLSFAKNHPWAQVYNQCSNLLLEGAIKAHHGIATEPLVNKFDGKQLPPMPRPGDVDFIYCGPPCQGFSRCNRFIKADDIKTSLIANALSYVDFYRPTYFLLENVRGLLQYRLGGVQVGPGRVSGGIEMGMLKFILRALTTMGYQTRFYVLQAGNFGLAQSRRRLFVWACKRGHRLPGVPTPITTFEKSNQTNINLPDGTTYAPFAGRNGNAPHHMLTVQDAIGDLPKFEFVNPALVYPDPDAEGRDSSWPQYIAVSGQPTAIAGDRDGSRGYVGHMEMPYESPPRSEFQRLRRRQNQLCLPGADSSYCELVERLHNHISRKFNAMNVERICRVALEPRKDHSSLPQNLKPWCLSAKESAASRHNGWKGLYGRLDPMGCFGTALTEMSPMGKSGTVLLHDQRRVLSVRECARAQGFPDKFRLYSIKENDTRDMHRQIGNAVPPPLAYALSLELREALFRDYVDCKPGTVGDLDTGLACDVLGDFCIDIGAPAPADAALCKASLAVTPTADTVSAGSSDDGAVEDSVDAGPGRSGDSVAVAC